MTKKQPIRAANYDPRIHDKDHVHTLLREPFGPRDARDLKPENSDAKTD